MTGPFATSQSKRRSLFLAALVAFAAPLALLQPASPGLAQPGERTSYVLLNAGTNSSTMSGSADDMRRARQLRVGREGLLYVRQGGSAWVIRDAETLRRAEAIFEPQRAMGARQAELGSRQAALGARQAALGSRQGALGAEQGRLGARQAGATPREAAALGRRMAELGVQQNALGEQQSALGLQQDALGRQQSALGREQSRLGREADVRLRALVAEAIRSGAAQRAN
ncbi:MAG TPA: hypothetical protein VEC11_01965 [Allosphingosinicella sp.]|nr:hypothetical protein [Allosphingosinicella sp.]